MSRLRPSGDPVGEPDRPVSSVEQSVSVDNLSSVQQVAQVAFEQQVRDSFVATAGRDVNINLVGPAYDDATVSQFLRAYLEYATTGGGAPAGEAHFVETHFRKIRFTPQGISDTDERRESFASIIDNLQVDVPFTSEPTLILGDAGAGKTTNVERCVQRLAASALRGETAIPIHLRLNNFSGDLSDLFAEALAGTIGSSFTDINPRQILKMYRSIIFMDGLNELGSLAEHGVRAIRSLIRRFPQNSYVITCRTADYGDILSLPYGWLAEPLDNAQVNAFIDRQELREIDRSTVRTHLKTSSTSAQLARNPLFLKAMLTSAYAAGALPLSRGQLIDKYVRTILQREESRGAEVASTKPRVKLRVLARLAYEMQLRHELSGREAFIRDVVGGHLREWDERVPWRALVNECLANGLIKASGDGGRLTFQHQVVQDYFAAYWLNECEDSAGLLRYARDPWWLQTILLLAGITRDPEWFIAQIAEFDLFLAAKCLLQAEHTSAPSTKLVVNGLISRATQVNNWTNRRTAIDLLGEMRAQVAVEHLVALTNDLNQEIRWGAVHALRQIGSSLALHGIRRALADSFWVVRGEAALTLADLNDELSIDLLAARLADPEVYVRSCATEALIKIGTLQQSPVETDTVSGTAEELLDFINSCIANRESTQWLKRCLSDNRPHIREATVAMLARRRAREFAEDVVCLTSDPDVSVRVAAVTALGRIGMPGVEERLAEMLRSDPAAEVRNHAAGALEQMGASNKVEGLIAAARDESPAVRFSAARSLGRLRAAASRPILRHLVQFDQDIRVREHALRALGFIGHEEDRELLEKFMMQETNKSLVECAAEAIENIERGHRELRF